HFETPNPELRLDESPFLVPTRLLEWPRRGGARLAGVSSFGIGGTNAHVVVEEPPPPAPPAPEAASCRVLVLSARTERALAELAGRYAVRAADAGDLDDLCYTAQVGRAHFEHRLALPVHDGGELAAALAETARGADRPGVARGRAAERPKVAFLFSGQG